MGESESNRQKDATRRRGTDTQRCSVVQRERGSKRVGAVGGGGGRVAGDGFTTEEKIYTHHDLGVPDYKRVVPDYPSHNE